MVSKKQIAEIEAIVQTMTMHELIALRTGVNERIKAMEDAEKDKFIAEAKEWADKARQLGLNLGEALGIAPARRPYARQAPANNSGDKAPIKAKYADGRGNSWSGRGLQPKWITAAIEEGRARSKEDFLIKE
jgi:DNA-binding protein H-NS